MMADKHYDILNEQMILAAACQDKSARAKVLGACSEDSFHDRHIHIFRALSSCGSDEAVDVAIVVHRAGKNCGGLKYVERLFTQVEMPKNLDVHLESLLKARARDVALTNAKLWMEDLADKTIDFDDVVRMGTKVLSGLAEPLVTRATGKDLADEYLADLADRRAGKVPFRPTGYGPFDQVLTYGFAPKLLTTLFGRPRNGKTSVMADWIPRLLRLESKPRILVTSCEEDKFSLLDMLVCNVASLDIEWLARKTPEMTNRQWTEVASKVKRMLGSDDRLVILGNPFLDVEFSNEAVLAETERIAATIDCNVWFEDMWERKLADNRQQSIMQALKHEHRCVEKYGYHKVITQQAQQEIEERRDKRPKLTDVKNSGGYNEVSDVVLGVHRERAYNPAARRDVVELEVLKQKKGAGGDVMEATFVGGQFRLDDERLADARASAERGLQEENKPKFMKDDPV